MDNKKTPWNDVSFIWKKIAGVIAAVGILATATVKIFNTPPEITYTAFAFLGLILLMISWYVDRQAEYTHKEMIDFERKAREDFKEIMLKAKDQTIEMKKDSNEKIENLSKCLHKVLEISEDTRKDTLRIQLMMLMKEQEDNIDTILKVAETYFVELQGDWYMTSEFNKWAKRHEVTIPDNIWGSMKNHADK